MFLHYDDDGVLCAILCEVHKQRYVTRRQYFKSVRGNAVQNGTSEESVSGEEQSKNKIHQLGKRTKDDTSEKSKSKSFLLFRSNESSQI